MTDAEIDKHPLLTDEQREACRQVRELTMYEFAKTELVRSQNDPRAMLKAAHLCAYETFKLCAEYNLSTEATERVLSYYEGIYREL